MSRRRKGLTSSITATVDLDRGDLVEVELGPFTDAGDTTADYDGVPIAVLGGIPGEHAVVEITDRWRDQFTGTVVGVWNPSEERVAASCPYYMRCTGCQLQHIHYDTQLQLKRERVRDSLHTYESLREVQVDPTLAAPAQFGYRNHARFTIQKSGAAGFVNRHTRRFVQVDACLLMNDHINDVLQRVQGNLPNMTQMSVRAGTRTGNTLIQPRLSNPDLGLESGQRFVEEDVLGRRYRVAASSFFQVNSAQAERMIQLVRDRSDLDGRQVLVDAYAGVGMFAISLAPDCQRVIAIEESSSAVKDARQNAAGVSNIEFLEGRVEDVLPGLSAAVDVLLLDPPRTGCHPSVLDAARALGPDRIVMVSCAPDSLARDLDHLCRENRYRVAWVQPVDMFPQTYHVECVVGLSQVVS